MTLRELIDHVTDFDSESIVLDYELKTWIKDGVNPKLYPIYVHNVTFDDSDGGQIYIEVTR